MRFSFEVGQQEKHTIEYEFNQLLGRLVIKVNNQAVARKIRLFSEPLKEAYTFVVGQKEQNAVRIEKQRMLLYGQVNRVFVNNRLYQRYEGI